MKKYNWEVVKMLVIKGKYNYAKIFLNEIDEKTKNQIKLLLDTASFIFSSIESTISITNLLKRLLAPLYTNFIQLDFI